MSTSDADAASEKSSAAAGQGEGKDLRDFVQLMKAMRAGDKEAARTIFTRYERALRITIRARLAKGAPTRSWSDSDIVQSVFASFFLRARMGEYDLRNPGQVIALLETMAKNKTVSETRKDGQQRRDIRRIDPRGREGLNAVTESPKDQPDQVVSWREMFESVMRLLNESERRIAELRMQEVGWDEIAQRMGGTAQARRKQLRRALERIDQDLGIFEEPSHDDE